MRKELSYEFTSIPPAKKAFKCVCDRLGIQPKEVDMGGGLSARSEDRTFSAQLQASTTDRGVMKVEVHIRVSDDEQLTAVTACFGEPRSERTVAPSQKTFAKIVVETEFKGDTESFVQEVCQKLDIAPDQFGNYRAMILSTARMKAAPDFIKEAAEKLKAL
ncbi:MAG: hypothetical protein ACFFBR_04350 [Promethearchaeota archaeon]